MRIYTGLSTVALPRLSLPRKFLVIFLGFLAFGAASFALLYANRDIDLINGQDWSHFAGADLAGDGVHIKNLGRAIVNQDGSPGQDNPPANYRGPKLLISGNFSLKATLSHAADGATLQFYGQLPVIYDEWRTEAPSLRITTAEGKNIIVNIWDGHSDDPVETQTFSAKLSNESFQMAIERHGGWLSLLVNNKQVGKMRDHGIFASKSIWFGADNTSDAPWVLGSLRAKALSPGRVSLAEVLPIDLPHNDPSSLRNLAAGRDHPLAIGAAVASAPLFTDTKYRNLAVAQFSMFTPENDFKPQFVHPKPDVYDFTDGDNIVELARQNDIAVHGHALVFGEANPQWMQETPLTQRRRVMLDHIANVVGNFRGDVAEWDVVNEPLSDDPADYRNNGNGLRHHIWYQAMGEGYIGLAFRAAHDADPNAKLFINEYGIEHDGDRWNTLLRLVTDLKHDGVPLDGIGFQAHIHTTRDHIDIDVLRAHIEALSGLGLASRISEIDVHGEDLDQQADQYVAALSACQAEPSCKSFTTWGITDKYGSTTDRGYPQKLGDDLIWDRKFKAKPALEALQAELRN